MSQKKKKIVSGHCVELIYIMRISAISGLACIGVPNPCSQVFSSGQLNTKNSLTKHLSTYPIVQYSVLGHAVGFTELLHPASIVAVQHLQAEASTVGARSPGVIIVT